MTESTLTVKDLAHTCFKYAARLLIGRGSRVSSICTIDVVLLYAESAEVHSLTARNYNIRVR
jgi:hypothetical protein